MTDILEWHGPVGCNGGDCPQIAVTHNGRVLVRSSKTPHMVAVLEPEEWQQLRTGDFGEVKR